jgi:hypothetical protein
MMHGHEIGPEMREAIQNCQECHSICTEITAYSVAQGGNYADPDHVGLLLDCSQMCAASEDFMLRLSHFHGPVCGVCADICLRCADSCERVGPADRRMKQCADVCRRCAVTCRRMAEAAMKAAGISGHR